MLTGPWPGNPYQNIYMTSHMLNAEIVQSPPNPPWSKLYMKKKCLMVRNLLKTWTRVQFAKWAARRVCGLWILSCTRRGGHSLRPTLASRAPLLVLFVRLLHSRTEFLFMNIHFTRAAVCVCACVSVKCAYKTSLKILLLINMCAGEGIWGGISG